MIGIVPNFNLNEPTTILPATNNLYLISANILVLEQFWIGFQRMFQRHWAILTLFPNISHPDGRLNIPSLKVMKNILESAHIIP
jgi:hypothetical protein